MGIRNTFDKIAEVGKKIGKRNWIIIGAVFVIGTAVCLNFALSGSKASGGGFDYNGASTEASGGGSDTSASGAENADSYFSSVQVSRLRARDEALEVLQSVVDNE